MYISVLSRRSLLMTTCPDFNFRVLVVVVGWVLFVGFFFFFFRNMFCIARKGTKWWYCWEGTGSLCWLGWEWSCLQDRAFCISTFILLRQSQCCWVLIRQEVASLPNAVGWVCGGALSICKARESVGVWAHGQSEVFVWGLHINRAVLCGHLLQQPARWWCCFVALWPGFCQSGQPPDFSTHALYSSLSPFNAAFVFE